MTMVMSRMIMKAHRGLVQHQAVVLQVAAMAQVPRLLVLQVQGMRVQVVLQVGISSRLQEVVVRVRVGQRQQR